MAQQAASLALLLMLVFSMSGVIPTTFTIINKCDYTVWPGLVSNAGVPTVSPTGFILQKGESKTITAPTSWVGRFWGRTLCSQDSAGKFSCATGDCGSENIECSGNGALPPATLAEFKLDGTGGLDFFAVSLVDGYNLPIVVAPQGGTGHYCTTSGCVTDLNLSCPSELRVTSAKGNESVACRSACEAFDQPQYCCSGAYGTPDTCKPSTYSQIFKTACPHAYTYAYDNKTSGFICASADYTITFCPNSNTRHKSSRRQTMQTPTTTPSSPSINNTTKSSQSTGTHVFGIKVGLLQLVEVVAGLLSISATILALCKFCFTASQ